MNIVQIRQTEWNEDQVRDCFMKIFLNLKILLEMFSHGSPLFTMDSLLILH